MPRLKKFNKRRYLGNRYTFPQSELNKSGNSDASLGTTITSSTEGRFSSRSPSPEASSSASKRKLKILNLVGEKSDYLKEEMNEGNIIIDLDILSKQLLKFASCRKCLGPITIVENTAKRMGIASSLLLLCTECDEKASFMSSKVSKSKHYDSNLRLVYAFRSIGKGQASAETFCSIVNLPPPPCKFHEYNKVLLTSIEKVSNQSMISATRDAINCNDNNSDICVAVDGTWHKRGHTSKHGVITVTSLDNGKVLDVACLTKYCPTCRLQKKDHVNCLANYEGTSGGMEAAGVLQIFQRSDKRVVPVRYTKFLGDEDSKAYDTVTENKPYGDNVDITKLECVEHVQKRLGTRLRRLKLNYRKKKLSDGKALGGYGRLTDDTIDRLQQYYGNAVRSSSGKTVADMKQAIWATFFHKSSTDAEPQHGMCPIGGDSWCKYNRAVARGLPCPSHDNSLPLAVMEVIKPVYNDLTENNLLKRCLHGMTQNCNEAFNQLIWCRLPKTTFVNGLTIQLGVIDAVLCYNEGALGKVKVLQELCEQAGANCVVGLKKQDAKRVKEAERAFEDLQKRARKAKRNVKRRLEDEDVDPDNPDYGAGQF